MSKHIHIKGEEEENNTNANHAKPDHPRDDLRDDLRNDLIDDQRDDLIDEIEPTSPSDDLPLAPAANVADDIAKRLEEAEQAAQGNYDRLLRVSAEFDNYKKRAAREMQDVIKYATEKLAAELLTVVDNLERAIGSAVPQRGGDDPLLQGVSLVLDDLTKILERHHVKPIKALGEPFDPALHQAMMQEPNGDYPSNTVVREMQKGYLIHDRLLRPSLVSVSTTAGNQAPEKNNN